jgi:hypothetical protein
MLQEKAARGATCNACAAFIIHTVGERAMTVVAAAES